MSGTVNHLTQVQLALDYPGSPEDYWTVIAGVGFRAGEGLSFSHLSDSSSSSGDGGNHMPPPEPELNPHARRPVLSVVPRLSYGNKADSVGLGWRFGSV